MAAARDTMDHEFAAAVARLCTAKFDQLARTGKPQHNEWTVLAGVVQCTSHTPTTAAELAQKVSSAAALAPTLQTVSTAALAQKISPTAALVPTPPTVSSARAVSTVSSSISPASVATLTLPTILSQAASKSQTIASPSSSETKTIQTSAASSECPPPFLEVVSLGSGSKCLGASKCCPWGSLVHDSHAEVVAKRTFQLYLLDQAKAAYRGHQSIFVVVEVEDGGAGVKESGGDPGSGREGCERSGGGEEKWAEEVTEGCGKEVTSVDGDCSGSCDGMTNADCVCSQSSSVLFPSDHCAGSNTITDVYLNHGEQQQQHHPLSTGSSISAAASFSCDRKKKKLLVLQAGITFHLFISHTPCGDCSIFPKQSDDAAIGNCVDATSTGGCVTGITTTAARDSEENDVNGGHNSPNRPEIVLGIPEKDCSSTNSSLAETSSEEPSLKRMKASNEPDPSASQVTMKQDTSSASSGTLSTSDIHRTGAKCAAGEVSDFLLPGVDYHNTGPLRTKPGRGDATLSHCCSDKLLKWSVLGVQGALLMNFLKYPVYLESLCIGRSPFNQGAMERGLFRRYHNEMSSLNFDGDNGGDFEVRPLRVLKCDVPFVYSREEVRMRLKTETAVVPCPASVSWYPGYGPNKSHVMVDGRKLGVTKKLLGTVKSQVPICRYQLMVKTIQLFQVREGKTEDQDTTACSQQGVRTDRANVDNRSRGATTQTSAVFSTKKEVTESATEMRDVSIVGSPVHQLTYRALKDRSVAYRRARDTLKKVVLHNWTIKPECLQEFTL